MQETSIAAAIRPAAVAVMEAEQLLRSLHLAESDRVIDQVLADHPMASEVLDLAIKIKCTRCEFSAARQLNERWQTVCGDDHPLVRIVDFADRSGWPDAPATADTVAGYLRSHTDVSKLHGSAIGTAGGQPVMILLFDINDQDARQLSRALHADLPADGAVRYICAGRTFLLQQMLREATGGVSELLNAIMAGERPRGETLH